MKIIDSRPPWGFRNPSKIDARPVNAHSRLLKKLPRNIRSVPGTPWEYLEGVPERAECAQGRPGMPERVPPQYRKTCPGSQNRHQVASRCEDIKFFLRSLLAQRCRSNLLRIFYNFGLACSKGKASGVLRLPAKTKVWPCAQRVESPAPWHGKQPRKTSKVKAKIDPKSSKMACRARPGGLVAQLWALEGLRASGPRRPSSLEAARASQPERPSSPRPARSRKLNRARRVTSL